jgi:hypothetical protein
MHCNIPMSFPPFHISLSLTTITSRHHKRGGAQNIRPKNPWPPPPPAGWLPLPQTVSINNQSRTIRNNTCVDSNTPSFHSSLVRSPLFSFCSLSFSPRCQTRKKLRRGITITTYTQRYYSHKHKSQLSRSQ